MFWVEKICTPQMHDQAIRSSALAPPSAACQTATTPAGGPTPPEEPRRSGWLERPASRPERRLDKVAASSGSGRGRPGPPGGADCGCAIKRPKFASLRFGAALGCSGRAPLIPQPPASGKQWVCYESSPTPPATTSLPRWRNGTEGGRGEVLVDLSCCDGKPGRPAVSGCGETLKDVASQCSSTGAQPTAPSDAGRGDATSPVAAVTNAVHQKGGRPKRPENGSDGSELRRTRLR